MFLDTLSAIYTRDLNKLKSEILAYKSEQNLWILDGTIKNSAGHLCLHLIGNLNAFISHELGDSGYVRNRELEFSAENISRDELITMIDQTIEVVKTTLDKIQNQDLSEDFPKKVFEEKTSKLFMLVHLSTHLAYHLGQIDYHRRLLDA